MGRPITRVVSSEASSSVVALNTLCPSPFNVSLLADLSAGGSATYTVEYTLDDVQSNAYVPASGGLDSCFRHEWCDGRLRWQPVFSRYRGAPPDFDLR